MRGRGRRRPAPTPRAGDPEGVRFERDQAGGVTVWRDGFPQSYVHPDDPELLAFEYVAQMALAVDALAPSGPLRVTHVGGAGLTLPRYVAHTRPGSPQIVLEPDAALTEAVRRRLPLPRHHRIRIRDQDGLTGVQQLAYASADAVLLDAFESGRVPTALATRPFLADVARVLAPGGLLVANLADEPGLGYVARYAATAWAAGLDCLLLGLHEVLKGRRYGNVVLVAAPPSGARVLEEAALRRAAVRCPFPTGVRGARDTRRLAAAARPFEAGDAEESPTPPPPGRWRAT